MNIRRLGLPLVLALCVVSWADPKTEARRESAARTCRRELASDAVRFGEAPSSLFIGEYWKPGWQRALTALPDLDSAKQTFAGVAAFVRRNGDGEYFIYAIWLQPDQQARRISIFDRYGALGDFVSEDREYLEVTFVVADMCTVYVGREPRPDDKTPHTLRVVREPHLGSLRVCIEKVNDKPSEQHTLIVPQLPQLPDRSSTSKPTGKTAKSE